MQRDKKGRFVKKAYTGTNLNQTTIFNPINTTTYDPLQFKLDMSTMNANIEALGQTKFDPFARDKHVQTLNTTKGFKTQVTPKIKYHRTADGKYIDQYGKELNIVELGQNSHLYEEDLNLSKSALGTNTETDPSAGMNLIDPMDQYKQKNNFTLDKTKMANFLELARAGIGASVNNKIADRALKAEKPLLQDVSESHRSVYGNYRAKLEGEKNAAAIRNAAAQPITSDGALQAQMRLEAETKAQDYINQGNAQDEAMIKQTREVAWQQEKENQQQRQAAAMQNRQAMLMSEKNKAQIENMRDSANYSQVVSPLLSATEQRLRNEDAEQKYYQDYYNDAVVEQNVWNSPNANISESQKILRDEYLKGGNEGVRAYIAGDKTKENDWLALSKLMNDEVLRQKAALKGVSLNLVNSHQTQNQFGIFGGSNTNYFPINKKGGTIYKAKLTKRTKDNDRFVKSIETSKKIAARFLEKAIDSLYDYNDVELIAKPKNKKRKYQAGGGLPFVGFTPVFATSEKGVPQTQTTEKGEDLTNKDILELLKDMDGLPSDMQIITASLQNFALEDKMDPLGLSSSNVASRYISLINKIKVAKFNKDEYNNAFNQVKGNGGLHEFAITSEGMLIGTNEEGDFQYFTPDQVNAGEPQNQGYSLLTNSNLLYLRANSLDAAFNHQLTTVAQNGIGMEVITKQINDIVSNLGSSKNSEEGFIQTGSNGQIKNGLQFLQKAAQEVGDDTINQNMSVADYYQAGYLTEDQAQQAQMALNYIYSALPANAKSMLQIKGGSTQGAEAIIKSLVFSKTSTETQFKATPKKMTKDGGSKSKNSDGLDLTPVQMMQVGYTDHMPVTLQKGTSYAMTINAQVLPITDVNKKLLGVTTLDRVAESTFGGALDMNNVTMGGQSIDPQALQNVQIDGTNLYVMNLPIDRNSPDGTIKPDLAWMTKIEAIDRTIRDQGITDIAQINKLYVEAGLPVLMDDNGQLNTRDYCKFGVLNGHALNTAFKDLDLLDNTVLEVEDEDQIDNILSILNKGRGEKDRIDFDSESWFDSVFGTDHDQIFEGTIYIPVRTNAFTGMIGGGEYPDTETAEQVEALIQQKERIRGYVDPGLLN